MGNRLSQTGPGGTVTYAYDANNRLLTAGSTTYAYDANGNLTAISTGQTFTWDVFNRLTQATGPGGTVTHTFNGDGLKVRRVGPDGTRRYYYDGIKPIWEADGAGVMTAQLDRDIFGNLLSRREASGARRYYHYDGLGSTTALTNETGAVAATMLYDAWGNQRAATGSGLGRYRFTGAELDAATGLYHMGARFYDPAIGRWLSEDPLQDQYFEPATLNFYAYVYGNPLTHIDPDGRVPVFVSAGIGALIGLGAYALLTDGQMTLTGAVLAVAFGAVAGAGVAGAAAKIGTLAAASAAGRAAAGISMAAIQHLQKDANKMSHIFDQARHGFGALGISADRGLSLIAQAIANGIQAAGGPSALPVGVHPFSMIIDAGVRITVRGMWDGTNFRIGTAFIEILVNGQWVPFVP